MSHAVDDSERQSTLQGEANTTAPKAPDAPGYFKEPYTSLNQNMHVVTWGSHPEAILKESHKETLGKNTGRLKHCTDCSSTSINAVYC